MRIMTDPLHSTHSLSVSSFTCLIPKSEHLDPVLTMEDDSIQTYQQLEYQICEDEDGLCQEGFRKYYPDDYYHAKREHAMPKRESALEESLALQVSRPPDPPCKLPKEILGNPLLSSAQLDALGLMRDRHLKHVAGRRCGFLLNDGCGTGKTRIIAAAILMSQIEGRKIHVWVYPSPFLKKQYMQELKELGYTGKFYDSEKMLREPSVIFVTYNMLRVTYSQIIQHLGDSFDGLIIFDECHYARNISITQNAVMALQTALPDSRVLYSSATAGSDLADLEYLMRLDLYGESLPFEHFKDFKDYAKQSGLHDMQMLAMELRYSGASISRAISYRGCHFFLFNIDLTPEQAAIYNSSCALWHDIFLSAKERDDLGAEYWSLFYGNQQRFFHNLISSFKVDFVAGVAVQAIKHRGASVVIGLQSTGEKSFERKESVGRKNDGKIVSTCAESLSHFLSTRMGNDYEESLRPRIESLQLPPNCLDLLRYKLEKEYPVAELTGRTSRYEFDYDRETPYASVVPANKMEDEVRRFQNDEAYVAIISDAGSAGISLHASPLKGKHRRPRVQILLEFPWSAEKALQQLGRTNRSDQETYPCYYLVTTKVPGELRFAATVSARVKKHGAITYGISKFQEEVHLQKFDLFNNNGRQAMKQTISHFYKNSSEVAEALEVVGLGNQPSIEQFFNRILALNLDMQKIVYAHFLSGFRKIVANSMDTNLVEDGIMVLDYGEVKFVGKKTYEFPWGEGRKRVEEYTLQKLGNRDSAYMARTYDLKNPQSEFDGYYREIVSGKVKGRVIFVYGEWRYTPSGSRRQVSLSPPKEFWKRVADEEGAKLWDAEMIGLRDQCHHTYRYGKCDADTCTAGMLLRNFVVFRGCLFSARMLPDSFPDSKKGKEMGACNLVLCEFDNQKIGGFEFSTSLLNEYQRKLLDYEIN